MTKNFWGVGWQNILGWSGKIFGGGVANIFAWQNNLGWHGKIFLGWSGKKFWGGWAKFGGSMEKYFKGGVAKKFLGLGGNFLERMA